jgi:hypothetical protein
MSSTVWVVLIIVALAVGAAAAWFYLESRRRTHLRDRFGPEYDRAIADAGDRRAAEQELARREDRVRHLEIRPLPPAERQRFAEEWGRVQAHFVDAPSDAIGDAEDLVTEVLRARGYPVGEFEQRAADISVDHPRVVENYRAARALRSREDSATTEDLRQAMVHYRNLFDDLLVDPRTEVRVERAS